MKSNEQISKKAAELIALASDTIIVNMRFMDVALNRMKCEEKKGLFNVATDGEHFFYDAGFVLRSFLEDENLPARMLLHSLLHMIFDHPFNYDKLDTDKWDIAVDIAVENVILDLSLPSLSLHDDAEREWVIRNLTKEAGFLSAERLYKYFLVNPLAKKDRIRIGNLFARDSHIYWAKVEDFEISEEAWKKISQRIKTDLGTFSKSGSRSESLIRNLEGATAQKYDYKKMLERFAVMGEELKINDDEFDYIYYTYGLEHYDNMPLIEPLEYKDERRVRDFAIVIDTSASCMGSTVRSFLRTTYDILKSTESFSDKINVHIIQCDNEVRQDVRIGSDKDFEDFIKKGKLTGYGGTDFRPAFDYVDGLIEDKEFENFKGLIYFTDGYGIYPGKAPDYDTMFVFVKQDTKRPEVPWWGIRVEIDTDTFSSEPNVSRFT